MTTKSEIIEMTTEGLVTYFEKLGMQKANSKIILSVIEQLDSVVGDDDKFNEFVHTMLFLNMTILTRMSEQDGMVYIDKIAAKLQAISDYDNLFEHDWTIQ